ncbi:MAG: hypothetical protein K2Y71_00900 [Xanthobacteraceae bacterium]|nr:hypothetical protein [Xanthobacteraceae bacterium]
MVLDSQRAGQQAAASRATDDGSGEAATAVAVAATESPLDYMLRVMRDPMQDDARRDAMAKAALPYVHARLTSVDGQLPDKQDGSISFTWQPSQE